MERFLPEVFWDEYEGNGWGGITRYTLWAFQDPTASIMRKTIWKSAQHFIKVPSRVWQQNGK